MEGDAATDEGDGAEAAPEASPAERQFSENRCPAAGDRDTSKDLPEIGVLLRVDWTKIEGRRLHVRDYAFGRLPYNALSAVRRRLSYRNDDKIKEKIRNIQDVTRKLKVVKSTTEKGKIPATGSQVNDTVSSHNDAMFVVIKHENMNFRSSRWKQPTLVCRQRRCPRTS